MLRNVKSTESEVYGGSRRSMKSTECEVYGV